MRSAESTSPKVSAGRVFPAGNTRGPWRLRFDDEFTRRALNQEHWSTGWLGSGITPPVNQRELECYNPRQVRVAGGALLLSLARRQESCGETRPFASGMVNSDGKFQFTYGFAQARIWLPGRGPRITNWPAFWMDGQHWPGDGEIDVVEGLAGQACWHFVDPHANPGGCAPGGYANGWHTFGADWEPGSITYYYDGHVTGRITRGITSAPMYLILNLAAARAYGSRIRVPATMRVDYVRVWQHPG
ncbi:MAG: glycoside hydrolase family 16 protein [Nocardiopsaceae bacterium]|nr:glycoside hydrolase family 16 protein [Nocardiopsaceae bacterium]